MKKVVLIVLLLSMTSHAAAQAYIPDDHALVLVEIEQKNSLRQLKVLRQELQKQVNNQVLLSNIVAQYIKLGREHADERYFSYAESLLKPYVQQGQLNVTVKLQWADILQRQHQFDETLTVLKEVLTTSRRHPQALLMRSVIYQTRGEYTLAMADCKALLSQVDLLISTTCIAQIDGLQGHLQRSISLLQQTIERFSNSDKGILRWSRTVLAEMYLRAGNESQASEYLDAVQDGDTHDYYAFAVKADILIRQARYDEVLELLRPHRKVSKLLLRYVIASSLAGVDSTADNDSLSAIIERAQLFSTGSHKRLLARYYLDVNNNPQRALIVARENWQGQREPDDALLLARCLLAANDLPGLQSFKQTLYKSGLSDKRLDSIFKEANDAS